MFIETDRLILRRWKETDLAPFAALNADPEVMRYFFATRSLEETKKAMAEMERRFDERGFAICAVERKADGAFVGILGIQDVPNRGFLFEPAVEIGWRLGSRFWRQGYATEGARAVIQAGFERFGLDEIVAFTATLNLPSQAVMKKLGMTRDPADDFDHPQIPAGHPLCPHVLYRMKRPSDAPADLT